MSNYVFNGIQYVEHRDRYDEHRTGVPPQGNMQVLQAAPAVPSNGVRSYVSAVHAQNVGEECALLRLRHGESQKTRANEWLTAFAVGGNRYVGKLQWRSLVAGTVRIVEGGALADIVDDGNGVLHDDGIPANVRGSIDYVNGLVDFTWGAAATEPVMITYDFTDFTDFVSPAQAHTVACTGVFPETFQLPFGRVNPGSLQFNTNAGALTFADDGKGNIVETTAAGEAVRGTIDYATGLITVNASSGGPLAGNFVGTYTFNPFASLVSKGGGCKLMDPMGAIPELFNPALGAGFVADTRMALVGEARSATQTALICKWFYHGEDPFRVDEVYSGFPAGGHSNDPRL